MNAQVTNETRELTADELEAVSGGLIPEAVRTLVTVMNTAAEAIATNTYGAALRAKPSCGLGIDPWSC
jgi:hypothetical protein